MTPTASEVHAGLYCRISADPTGLGLGVERQRTDCLRLAKELGWSVADVYIDNDISAYSGKRRPQYQRLLADIGSGVVTGVVTWHPDRLNRSPRELERLIDLLERNNVRVASVTAGFFDLGTPSGRAVARTLGAWARFESEHKSERIKAQKHQAALAGQPARGGHRAFGFTADRRTVVPAEAAIVRDLMRRLLAGESTSQMRASLKERGILTTQGNPWGSDGIARMLCSPRIAGWTNEPIRRGTAQAANSRKFLAKGSWKPIVSRADVERARALLLDETLRAGSHRRWLMSGIVLCGSCGRPLCSQPYDTPTRFYACWSQAGPQKRCTKIAIRGAAFEDDVVERLHGAVEGGVIKRILDSGPAAFLPTIEAARQANLRLRQLAQDRDDGLIDTAEWAGRHRRITCRSMTARAADLAREEVDLPMWNRRRRTFAARWDKCTMREKRSLVLLLTRSVVITRDIPNGVRRYEPSRVHVTWRA
jgi:site-specific DNA recombinase